MAMIQMKMIQSSMVFLSLSYIFIIAHFPDICKRYDKAPTA